MAGTVVAVFEDKQRAEHAAHALLDAGVPLADISLVLRGAGGETGAPTQEGNLPEVMHEEALSHAIREVPLHDVEQPMSAKEEIIPRAVAGIVTGFPLGALLVSTAIFIPGVGALLAAGPLVAMMGGAVAGGVLGGLTGALTAGGIPQEAARSYHAHVEHGDTLVTVLSSGNDAPKLQAILKEQGGHELGFFGRFMDTLQSIES